MPFAHVHYRWLRGQNYDYAKRRCCFIAVCLTYSLIFAVLGAIFLGLYVDRVDYFNSLNCPSACGYLSAPINCGTYLCCDSNGFSFSYEYCTGVYGLGTYFLLFIIFFCYAFYEIVLMICTLCNGSALQNTNVIVIDQNPQYVGLNAYPNQQIYQGNQQQYYGNQQQYYGNQQQMNYKWWPLYVYFIYKIFSDGYSLGGKRGMKESN